MDGWIKIHRKFLDWEWFRKPEMVQLFLYLLMNANARDKTWQGKFLRRGQLFRSVRMICDDTGLSPRQVRTCFSRFLSSGELIIESIKKSTNQGTLITICNYDSYQDTTMEERQTTDKPPTNHRQTSTYYITEEGKKDNINNSACACASDGLTKEISELKESPIWAEQMCMRYRLNAGQFYKYLDDFELDCRCRGTTGHSTTQDAQRHFNDWLRIQLKEKNNGNNRNNNSTPESRAAEAAAIIARLAAEDDAAGQQ